MAGKRPKDADIAERLDFSLGLLCLVWPKWRIKDALQAQYGVTRSAAERDVSRAREKMREEDDIPRSDKRSKLSALLEGVMGDEALATRSRMTAVVLYMKLHGLEIPISEDEIVAEDIQIVVPDWRGDYQKKLDAGQVKTVTVVPAVSGADIVSANKNLLLGSNGNGNGNGSNGNGANGAGKKAKAAKKPKKPKKGGA